MAKNIDLQQCASLKLDECIDKFMKKSGYSKNYLAETNITLQDFSTITNIPTFLLLQDVFDKKLPALTYKGKGEVVWVNYLQGLNYYYKKWAKASDKKNSL